MHLTLFIFHSIAEILPAVSTMRDSSNFNQTKRLNLALDTNCKKTKVNSRCHVVRIHALTPCSHTLVPVITNGTMQLQVTGENVNTYKGI